MSLTVYIGIVLILVLAGLGAWIFARRDSFAAEPRKGLYLLTGGLQAVHLLLYVTGALDALALAQVGLAFGISAALALGALLLSGWMLLPVSRCRHPVRFLFLVLGVLQVAGTVLMFLLPEAGAGLPPLLFQ